MKEDCVFKRSVGVYIVSCFRQEHKKSKLKEGDVNGRMERDREHGHDRTGMKEDGVLKRRVGVDFVSRFRQER